MTGRPSPHEPASAPSRNALIAFFGQLERVAQERRHPRDYVVLNICADLKPGGLLRKAQGTDRDEGGNVTEPGQREGQVAGALVR